MKYFCLKIYLSWLAWLDPWTRPLMTFSESLVKWWIFFVWPHDLNWNIQDVLKFFRKAFGWRFIQSMCFFFQEICQIGLGWSRLEIWNIRPSNSWLQVATPDLSGVFGSLKLVGRLQHEHLNCGTRKESQNLPTFFGMCLLVEVLGLWIPKCLWKKIHE